MAPKNKIGITSSPEFAEAHASGWIASLRRRSARWSIGARWIKRTICSQWNIALSGILKSSISSSLL